MTQPAGQSSRSSLEAIVEPPASLPSTVLENTPASPSPGSHDYDEVVVQKRVWTRGGNIVEPFEAALLDLELAKVEKGEDFPPNMTGDNDGLVCIPTNMRGAATIPANITAVDIVNRLPPDNMHRAGARLYHAHEVIHLVTCMPTVYKIGITTNPVWRWSQYKKEETYDKMHLIDFSNLPGWAPMMEAALIRDYIGASGCYNVASGGEGPRSGTGVSDAPGAAGGFVYIVTGDAGKGKLMGPYRHGKKPRLA